MYLDPAETNFPFAFNILDCKNPEQRPLVCSAMVSIFQRLWPGTWSGRQEYLMRNALLALIENEGSSLLGVLRIISSQWLRAHRKVAIVVIIAAAAIVTPGADPFTPTFLAIPLILLYEASILVLSRVFHR